MAISLGQLNKDNYVQTTDSNSAITDLKFNAAGTVVSISANGNEVIFKDSNEKMLSSSVAAKAISADILIATVGDESTPIYFDNGQIKTCTISTVDAVYTDDVTLSTKLDGNKKTFYVLKDYAMSSDVSSKTELDAEFAKCWKAEAKGSLTKPVYFDNDGIKECNPISSAAELSVEMKLSDYALSNDIPKDLTGFTDSTNKYALNSNVSSKTELDAEFNTLSAVRNAGKVMMTGELEGGIPFTFYVLSIDNQ